jgi:hypothetical protein
MWIFKIKSDTEGVVSRFEARFVAKGCSQRAGQDYTETFSPVIRMASLHLFLAIAVVMDLDLCKLDIDIAFVYAPITKHIYIRKALGVCEEVLLALIMACSMTRRMHSRSFFSGLRC